MAIALGILYREGSQSFTEFKISEDCLRRSIRELCGLFVFINHSKIYLIHQTAKEFLVQKGVKEQKGLWRHSLEPNKSERMMARVCVEYLLLDELSHLARRYASEGRSGNVSRIIRNRQR